MVGSIDPRCETLRGTHWPKKGRLVVWNSRRGSHLGQRSTDRINRPDIWMQAIRSDRQKTLVARGPSTYGSLLSQGRQQLSPQRALRVDIESIDRLARRHEQPVAFQAAEAQVGAAFGD